MFIDPLQLPSVCLSRVKELPTCTAIYFAIDSQNRILYIGRASNLFERWKNHHRQGELEEKYKSVKIAWQIWNEESLNEAEAYLIKYFQPLLNGTEVKSPEVIPSETIFRNFLKIFSRRLIIIGFQPKTTKRLPCIRLKYNWEDCSPNGTAARIKKYIKENNCKNTSFKIISKPYGRIRSHADLQIGSREQKALARQNRSYSNHWEMGCNGAIIQVTPFGGIKQYKNLKSKTVFKELAGIRMRAVSQDFFADMSSQYSNDFSGLSCYDFDLVPLLWDKQ